MAEAIVDSTARWELPSGSDRVVIVADLSVGAGLAIVALEQGRAIEMVSPHGPRRFGDGSVDVEVGPVGRRFIVDLRRVPEVRTIGVAVWAAPGQPAPVGDITLEDLAGRRLVRRPLDDAWGPGAAAGVVAVLDGGRRRSFAGRLASASDAEALARQLTLPSAAALGAPPRPSEPGATRATSPPTTPLTSPPVPAEVPPKDDSPPRTAPGHPPEARSERDDRTRRPRRLRPVAATVLGVVIIAAGVAIVLPRLREGDDLDRLADPKTVELPDPTEEDLIRSQLEGDARGLVELIDLDPLVRGEGEWSAAACRALAPELATLDEPGVLRLRAQALPEPATAEMAGAYLDALVVFLAACSTGEPTDVIGPLRDDLAFAATVFSRRVEQIGVAR